jgi:hypothetical protein
MRKLFFSIILCLILGPAAVPILVLIVALGSGGFVALLLGLFGLLLLGAVVAGFLFFSTKGMTNLLQTLNVSPLPRSIARSVAESRHYGRMIMRVAQQYPPGPLRDRLNLTLRPVNEWLNNLTRLEQGLSKLYSQRNLAREVNQTTLEINDLRRRSLMALTDREIQMLRELMDSKKQHLATLKELQLFQNQAELKIRKIASDLGRTHAEMLLIVAKGDFNDNRINRLDQNLQDHLASMRDMLAAMDDMGYSQAAA